MSATNWIRPKRIKIDNVFQPHVRPSIRNELCLCLWNDADELSQPGVGVATTVLPAYSPLFSSACPPETQTIIATDFDGISAVTGNVDGIEVRFRGYASHETSVYVASLQLTRNGRSPARRCRDKGTAGKFLTPQANLVGFGSPTDVWQLRGLESGQVPARLVNSNKFGVVFRLALQQNDMPVSVALRNVKINVHYTP